MTIKKLITPVGSLSCLLAFLLLTNPQRLPIILLVVPFGLIFGLLFSTARLVITLLKLPTPHWLLTPFIIAFVPTLLLILGTISQLTLRDSLLIIVFALGLLAYLRRANFWRA